MIDIVLCEFSPLQILLHEGVLGFNEALDHLLPFGLSRRFQIGGNILEAILPSPVVLINMSLHSDEIDNPFETTLLTNRDDNRDNPNRW